MSFARDVQTFAQKAEKALDKTVRAVTFSLFREVIQRTPVDTGRLKGNWQTSTGSPVTTTLTRTDPTGATTIAAIWSGMGGLGSVSYMSNALPYAARIEYDGHSSVKAPAGMVRVSMARIHSIVQKAARDNKV